MFAITSLNIFRTYLLLYMVTLYLAFLFLIIVDTSLQLCNENLTYQLFIVDNS